MGHRCKALAHILIVLDLEDCEEEEDEGVDPEASTKTEEEMGLYHTPHISLHAMSGIVLPKTLRFKGFIGKMHV